MHKNNKSNSTRNKIKVILLIVIGIIAFLISTLMNIWGLKNSLKNNLSSENKVGFSIRETGITISGNKKETKLDDNGKVIEENIKINSGIINKLVNSRWDRVKANISGFDLDQDGNAIFKDGITLFCNKKYVNYVVFNKNYKEEVIGEITVGTDFQTIEKKLGIPTFKSKDYIGYKTNQVYVFFYDDEICVYSNRYPSNEELEKLFQEYFEKTYGKSRAYFSSEIRNKFEDFIITLDEESDTVILKSITRQVIVKLDSIGNIEVEFYNGYHVKNSITQNYIDKKIYLTNEQDLVEIVENERISENR